MAFPTSSKTAKAASGCGSARWRTGWFTIQTLQPPTSSATGTSDPATSNCPSSASTPTSPPWAISMAMATSTWSRGPRPLHLVRLHRSGGDRRLCRLREPFRGRHEPVLRHADEASEDNGLFIGDDHICGFNVDGPRWEAGELTTSRPRRWHHRPARTRRRRSPRPAPR